VIVQNAVNICINGENIAPREIDEALYRSSLETLRLGNVPLKTPLRALLEKEE
jgi:hypothetical protein